MRERIVLFDARMNTTGPFWAPILVPVWEPAFEKTVGNVLGLSFSNVLDPFESRVFLQVLLVRALR